MTDKLRYNATRRRFLRDSTLTTIAGFDGTRLSFFTDTVHPAPFAAGALSKMLPDSSMVVYPPPVTTLPEGQLAVTVLVDCALRVAVPPVTI